jgi:hypothetical protein
MKYEIKEKEFFIWLLENDDTLAQLEEMFLNEELGYYSPENNFDEIIDYTSVWKQIIEWEEETHEAFSDACSNSQLKKLVVEYVIVDQFFEYQTNNIANTLGIKKKAVKNQIQNLLDIYLVFGIDTFLSNKETIKPVIKRAYELKEQGDYFSVVYNIEMAGNNLGYIISPFLSKQYNQSKIVVPRLLCDNRYIKEEKQYE